MKTWQWIVLALVVLALIVVAVLLLRRSRATKQVRQREHARELRQQAEADRIEVQRREAEAARVDAQARLAQAEAQARAADAEQLQVQAREHAEHASGARAEVEERLRKADELDPDGAAGRARSAVDATGTTSDDGSRGYGRTDGLADERTDRPGVVGARDSGPDGLAEDPAA